MAAEGSTDQDVPPGAHHRRRTRVGLVTLAAVVAAAAAALMVRGVAPSTMPTPMAASDTSRGTTMGFAYLAAQHSNFCSLARSTVESDPAAMRLQGACCSAMDLAKYQMQVRELRTFTAIPQIPPDPYNIAVPLARSLFHDDDVISLSAAESRTYSDAIAITADKGPCCCHCWRWSMTEGLAKRLINVNHFPAATVARVVDLVNGCGGPLGTAATPTAPR